MTKREIFSELLHKFDRLETLKAQSPTLLQDLKASDKLIANLDAIKKVIDANKAKLSSSTQTQETLGERPTSSKQAKQPQLDGNLMRIFVDFVPEKVSLIVNGSTIEEKQITNATARAEDFIFQLPPSHNQDQQVVLKVESKVESSEHPVNGLGNGQMGMGQATVTLKLSWPATDSRVSYKNVDLKVGFVPQKINLCPANNASKTIGIVSDLSAEKYVSITYESAAKDYLASEGILKGDYLLTYANSQQKEFSYPLSITNDNTVIKIKLDTSSMTINTTAVDSDNSLKAFEGLLGNQLGLVRDELLGINITANSGKVKEVTSWASIVDTLLNVVGALIPKKGVVAALQLVKPVILHYCEKLDAEPEYKNIYSMNSFRHAFVNALDNFATEANVKALYADFRAQYNIDGQSKLTSSDLEDRQKEYLANIFDPKAYAQALVTTWIESTPDDGDGLFNDKDDLGGYLKVEIDVEIEQTGSEYDPPIYLSVNKISLRKAFVDDLRKGEGGLEALEQAFGASTLLWELPLRLEVKPLMAIQVNTCNHRDFSFYLESDRSTGMQRLGQSMPPYVDKTCLDETLEQLMLWVKDNVTVGDLTPE